MVMEIKKEGLEMVKDAVATMREKLAKYESRLNATYITSTPFVIYEESHGSRLYVSPAKADGKSYLRDLSVALHFSKESAEANLPHVREVFPNAQICGEYDAHVYEVEHLTSVIADLETALTRAA